MGGVQGTRNGCCHHRMLFLLLFVVPIVVVVIRATISSEVGVTCIFLKNMMTKNTPRATRSIQILKSRIWHGAPLYAEVSTRGVAGTFGGSARRR